MEKIKELKSEAYDILANIEALQRRMQQINQAIAEESSKVEKANQEPIKK